MAVNRQFWWITALGGGLLAGAALPPLGCPPLLWLALVPLWAQGPRAACVWGAGAVLVSHRWLLWLHPLDWVGVPLPLSLPLCLLLLAACALLGGLLVGSWRWLVQRLGAEGWWAALLAASAWGLAEVLLARGPLFWIGLGSAALPGDRALAGLAQGLGAGGLAALQLLLGWGLWRVLDAAMAEQRRWWRWAMAWLAAVLVLHLWGWQLLQPLQRQAALEPQRTLLLLQPAIPTRHKFEFVQQQLLLRRLMGAQEEAQARGASALVLPEGALALGQPLPQPAAVEVLTGGFRLEDEQLRSALLAFPAGQQQPQGAVDKHRLVPLGEWVPLSGLVEWAGLSAVGGLSPGAPSRLLSRPLGSIGVAICYEVADGTALAAATREGAGWLLASANLDPYPAQLQRQFAALAQLRAIETSRWLVSAANTGPSLAVDPAGVVQRQLPAGEAATLPVQVQPRQALSFYGRWGELPLLLAALAGGMGAGRVAWNARLARTRQS
jgi:apolipoprotein N-acyltransferase